MTHSIFTTQHLTYEEIIAIDDKSWRLSHLEDNTWLMWKRDLIQANCTYSEGVIILGSISISYMEDISSVHGTKHWRLFKEWLIEEGPSVYKGDTINATNFKEWLAKPRPKSVLI